MGEWKYNAMNSYPRHWLKVIIFTTSSLTLGEQTPGTQWIRRWMGPKAVVDAVKKRKISASDGNRTDSLVFQPVAYSLYSLS
jgi:hypothetical protein